MSGTRAGLSVGVIVALVVAIWAAVSSGEEEPVATSTTTTTTAVASTTATTVATTTTAPSTTVTTTAPTSTTDGEEARLEEVRLILEDLYFRWFDAIYRNDEEAVMDVIATPERLESFRTVASNNDYPRAPQPDDVVVTNLEILRDSPDCLVTFSTVDVTAWRGAGMTSSGVDVLWPRDSQWRIATLWTNPSDLWEVDCTADRSDELP